MELKGRIIVARPQRSGKSQKGEWVAQEFVLETNEQYPKKVVFNVFGKDKLERFNIQIGMTGTVYFDVDANEWNGKWYNNITAYDFRMDAVQPL